MIVIVGSAAYLADPAGTGRAAGPAAEIAAAAAAAGAGVELLTRIGEDGAGEELLLALARSGVGHLAVLRDSARPTALVPLGPATADPEDDVDDVPALLAEAEVGAARSSNSLRPLPPATAPGAALLEPADVSLGLRYLREYQVVVAVEPLAEGSAAVVGEAAAFAGAALVVVASPGRPAPEEYATATVLEAPADDPEGAFALLVGEYAAALDRGVDPGDAFRAAAQGGGWEVSAD